MAMDAASEPEYVALSPSPVDETNPLGSDYLPMNAPDRPEPWLMMLNWIQRLLSALHKHYLSKEDQDWSEQESYKLVLQLQKHFTSDSTYTASVEKFAHFLSYGEHICYILHLVNDDWIDMSKIQNSEQLKNSEFLAEANIDLFRNCCDRKLHISSKHIVKTEQLQRLSEFGKLVTTFSTISKNSVFTCRLGEFGVSVVGFAPQKYEAYDLSAFFGGHEFTMASEDYLSLPQQLTHDEYLQFDHVINTDSSSSETVESAYPAPAIITQDTQHDDNQLGSQHLSEEEEKLRKTEQKIQMILNEIEETESRYSGQLQYLSSVYRKTLVDIGYANLATDIFDDTKISDLSASHLHFLSDLIAAERDVFKFTAAFIQPDRIKTLVKYYTHYMKNFDRAQDKIDYVLENVPLDKAQFLIDANDRAALGEDATIRMRRSRKSMDPNQPPQTFRAKSFNIKENFKQPFQRFLRYSLLLGSLLDSVKKTKKEENIAQCEFAFFTWKKVAAHLNLVKADEDMASSALPKVLAKSGIIEEDEHETTQSMFKQYNKVQEFEKYGRLKKDEALNVVVEHGNKSRTQKFNVVLTELQLIFSKSIIVSIRMGINSNLKYEYGPLLKNPKKQDCKDNIRITYAKTSYTLIFPSYKSYAPWKQMIESVIDMCRKSPEDHNKHIFEYYSFQVDKEPVFCSVCGFVLAGLVWQGHLCIICKSTVHPECRSEAPPCCKVAPSAKTQRSASVMETHRPSFGGGRSEEEPGNAGGSSAPVAAVRRHMTFMAGDTLPEEEQELPLHRLRRSLMAEKPIEEQGWYIGMASKQAIRDNLQAFTHTHGAFCVRESDREPGFRIAIVGPTRNVKHLQIFVGSGKYFLDESEQFSTVTQLVEHYMCVNLSSVYGDSIDGYLSSPLADLCYESLRQVSQANAFAAHRAIGAGIVQEDITAFSKNGGNDLNVTQGQLLFLMENSASTFECDLPTKANLFEQSYFVEKSLVRVITSVNGTLS